jgi:hypothetical protein
LNLAPTLNIFYPYWIFFHLQEHESARDLVQYLKEDDFAKECIAPDGGISRSTFSEAINSRGLEQLQYVFQVLYKKAQAVLPSQYSDLGDLVSIDGSLIDGVLSMYWTDYRKGSKKAKGHFGFDVNRKIPMKVYLTEGNGAERPFVSSILSEGQTGIMDREYQSHNNFDDLQDENKHFACRIKSKTTRTIISQNPVNPNSNVFYDALVLLGIRGVNQSKTPVGHRDFFQMVEKASESVSLDCSQRIRSDGSNPWGVNFIFTDGHILP